MPVRSTIFLLTMIGIGTAVAEDIELYADINSKGGGITEGAACDGWFYFAYNDGVHGIELWRSDGTAGGTALFADLNPGPASSSPRAFAGIGDRLWFAADTGDGHEPWSSDGTVSGTAQAGDVEPGATGSDPGEFGPAGTGVVFYATTTAYGREPWYSDGTTVTLVADINAGPASSVAATQFDPRYWGQLGSSRVFVAKDTDHGVELFISDGNTATLIDDINSYSFYPGRFFGEDIVQVGDRCFFSGGGTLCATDGTTIWQVGDLSNPRDLVAVGDVLYCVVNNTGLYRIADGGDTRTKIHTSASSILNLAAVNGHLYFRDALAGEGGELWHSDGTSAGTGEFADLRSEGGSEPALFTALDSATFVFLAKAEDGTAPDQGYQLYASDGTPGGTELIDQIDDDGIGVSINQSVMLGTANGHAFFTTGYRDVEGALLATDGTAGGSGILREPRYGPASSTPTSLVAMDNGVICAIADPNRSSNLDAGDLHLIRIANDGSSVALQDLEPDVTGQLGIASAGRIGDHVWASGRNGTNSDGATWVSDAAIDGETTKAVSDTVNHFRDLGDGAGVFVRNGALWRISASASDPADTITEVPGPSDPEDLLVIDGALFFTAKDSGTRTLWHYDGDSAQTLTDLAIAAGDWLSSWHRFASSRIVHRDGTLFVPGADGHLYSCPAAGGTTTRITTGLSGDPAVAEITAVGDRLYFAATGPDGRELYISDGSAGNASLVTDAHPTGDADPIWLTAVGDRLFFTADDGSHGRELWIAGPTGAHLVSDVDDSNKAPEQLIAVNGICLFVYEHAQTGIELWRSDGTATGTHMVHDLNPGNADSNPFNGDRENTLVIGDTIYFPATQPAVGCELFSYTVTTNGSSQRTIAIDLNPTRADVEAVCDGQTRPLPAEFTGKDPADDHTIDLIVVPIGSGMRTVTAADGSPRTPRQASAGRRGEKTADAGS